MQINTCHICTLLFNFIGDYFIGDYIMKWNARSLLRKPLFMFIAVTSCLIFVCFAFKLMHSHEGIIVANVINHEKIKHIIIEPETSKADYLHMSEFQIYDMNGSKMKYTASSPDGIFNGDKQYDYIALTDNDETTFFHSGQRGSTLKIIPKDTSLKISRIYIKNRVLTNDCFVCHERLRDYKISLVNENYDVFFTKKFSDMENLYISPFMEEILFTYPEDEVSKKTTANSEASDNITTGANKMFSSFSKIPHM